jgi:hypothetical protein
MSGVSDVSIQTFADVTNNWIVLQVSEGYSGADVEAHWCIHLGGSVPHWSWHGVPDNGGLDPTYPESHDFHYKFRHYFPCGAKFNKVLDTWRPSLVLWSTLSLRYDENPSYELTNLTQVTNSVCSEILFYRVICIALNNAVSTEGEIVINYIFASGDFHKINA